MRVLAAYRYPVKSAGGEALTSAELTTEGVAGDRRWACLDADGVVVSAKQPRRWRRLLDVATCVTADGVLLTVPGAAPVPAGSAEADAALSAWLGRPVRLTTTVPAGAVLHRWWPDVAGMIPDWNAGAVPGQDATTAIGSGRFVDFGAVHLVTTGALARLAGEHGAEVDHRRFRPNLLLDLPADPEPGQRLRIGAALVEVVVPTPRCVVPSLDHALDDGAGADPELLRTLARHHRVPVVPYGTATCFGVYADVVRPGVVEVDASAPGRGSSTG